MPVDLKEVRADSVRGAWVLRDAGNILLNFGPDRAGAEQAAAVCRRYGFNRVGLVGFPAPKFAYLFAAPVAGADRPAGADPSAALVAAAQEQHLTRTGVPVPGAGFVGERLVIDHRKAEVRKDRSEWVLAHGPDVLVRFGASEWAARDALKVVQDLRATEFCTVAGVTFLLVNGAAPTRVPFAAQGSRFSPAGLQVRPADARFAVYDGAGRQLFVVGTKEEGEQLVQVIRAFQFDQTAQVGLSPRASLRFLAKTGGR